MNGQKTAERSVSAIFVCVLVCDDDCTLLKIFEMISLLYDVQLIKML